MAIYECRECENEEFLPHTYTFHFGEHARCPRCGTLRVTRLKMPDRIDPMYPGLLNRLERMSGGALHHCCFCRIQFYDRRKLAPRTTMQPMSPETSEPIEAEPVPPKARPDKASSDE